ncbi:hypothetical protein KFL_000390060 [Klebsormidium nitens]|uniref:Uncharacterized protein n=1 Tax=Klebsormidium nitens TaxID=105231 RepID=A0A1Y1HVF4_KLENI|nr:hypothetical protein KFL_000390060 [Klebsormidium nitens]|eukprot:GAQ79818.1 hypothetical protein KFL_000390060 [Klebsormidium nitens]
MAPPVTQQRRLMALLSACFLCATLAQGASEPFLSLPEPSLVNAFLLATPPTGPTRRSVNKPGQYPSSIFITLFLSLQVIKCASLTPGPSYDFYQVQVPGYNACEAPPPRIYNTHHQSASVWDHKGLALVDFLSLTIWSSVLAFIVVFLVVLCCQGPDGRNLVLRLCQTSVLNFYVGHFDTSCPQLWEPYGGRSPAGESGWQDPVGEPKGFCVYLNVAFGESILIIVTALLIGTVYLVWVTLCWLSEKAAVAPEEEDSEASGDDVE